MQGLITIIIVVVSIVVSIRQDKGRKVIPLIIGLLMIGAQFFAMGSAMNRLVGDVADMKSHIKTNADAIKVLVIVVPIAILWIYGTWRMWKKQGMNVVMAAALAAMVYIGMIPIIIATLIILILKIKNLFF